MRIIRCGITGLVLLIAVTLTGCGNKNESPTSENARATETAGKHQAITPHSSISSTKAKPKKKKPLTPVYMGVWGYVGGTTFLFDMNGLTGSYIPYDMAEAKEYGQRRQLKLISYDPKSGACVINAYLNDSYIGQFKGTFVEEEVEKDDGDSYGYQYYHGVFISVKGDELKFSFHFD